jgi:hypothetical protein
MYKVKWRGQYIGYHNKQWHIVNKEHAHEFKTKRLAERFINNEMCLNVKCKSIEVEKV